MNQEERKELLEILRGGQTLVLPLEIPDAGLDEDEAICIMPERIVKSGRATIVFWGDGGKTVVKRQEGEANDDYAAFTAALGIRVFGSNSRLKSIIRDYTVEQKPKTVKDACPIDRPCGDDLNEKARKQYEAYRAKA